MGTPYASGMHLCLPVPAPHMRQTCIGAGKVLSAYEAVPGYAGSTLDSSVHDVKLTMSWA
eukprot:15470131-Alexandrium_andersonii.AAC.1